jgi:hypothetical protein
MRAENQSRKSAGRKKLALGKQTVKDLASRGARHAKGGALSGACQAGAGADAGIADPQAAPGVSGVRVVAGGRYRCADGSARWVVG